MSAEKETSGAVGPTPMELAVGAAIASARYGGSWAWINANAVETEQFLYEARAAIQAVESCQAEEMQKFIAWLCDEVSPTPASQERATPSPTLAEPLQGAEAPQPKLQEDTAHHAAGTRGIGVGETVGSLPPVAPTPTETNSNE